jgi:hypothetical protein
MQERGRFRRGCKGTGLEWYDSSSPPSHFFLVLISSRLVTSIDWVVGAWHLWALPCQSTSPLSLRTIHTSLTLVGGGSWRRPTLSGPSLQLFLARLYSKRHLTPTSGHTNLFFCFVFPRTSEKTQDVYKAVSIDFLSHESLHCIMSTYVIKILKEVIFLMTAELLCWVSRFLLSAPNSKDISTAKTS